MLSDDVSFPLLELLLPYHMALLWHTDGRISYSSCSRNVPRIVNTKTTI